MAALARSRKAPPPEAGRKAAAPAEVGPLRSFSWREVAASRPLPLGGGEAPASGLLVYEAPAGAEAAALAALAAELLRDGSSRVVLGTVSVTPADVVEALLGLEPGTSPAERRARLHREERRLRQWTRRLESPRGGGYSVQDLLGWAREGPLAFVLEPASRLEMEAPAVPAWLRDLHDAGSHGGFPVFLVAPVGWIPAGGPAPWTFLLDPGPPPRVGERRPWPAA